eukprot:7292390-Prymnesium_polylepis.2
MIAPLDYRPDAVGEHFAGRRVQARATFDHTSQLTCGSRAHAIVSVSPPGSVTLSCLSRRASQQQVPTPGAESKDDVMGAVRSFDPATSLYVVDMDNGKARYGVRADEIRIKPERKKI